MRTRGFRIVGDLSIRDVTREVVLDAEYGGRAKDPWGNERIGFELEVQAVKAAAEQAA